VTEDFLLESQERYQRQSRGHRAQEVLKIILAVTVLLISAFRTVQGRWSEAVPLAAIGAVIPFISRAERWKMRRAFRKSPFISEEVTSEFSHAHVRFVSPKQDVTQQWSSFTEVVHFKDGFLFLLGPGVFDWWPVSAFQNPSDITELKQLLEAKIPKHRIAETGGGI
jgi:hypothetical protein